MDEIGRLRAQNKASSDAWQKRTADLQRRYDRLLSLFRWAMTMATKTHNDGKCPLCYKPHGRSQRIASESQFAAALVALREGVDVSG